MIDNILHTEFKANLKVVHSCLTLADRIELDSKNIECSSSLFSDDDDKDNHYSGRTNLNTRETIDKSTSTPHQNNVNDNVIENLNFINQHTARSTYELFVDVKKNTPKEKEDFQ